MGKCNSLKKDTSFLLVYFQKYMYFQNRTERSMATGSSGKEHGQPVQDTQVQDPFLRELCDTGEITTTALHFNLMWNVSNNTIDAVGVCVH